MQILRQREIKPQQCILAANTVPFDKILPGERLYKFIPSTNTILSERSKLLMKNALKHIISMVLIAAIAITGVNFGGEAVTANAATKYETLTVNSSGDSITINMKVGETKRLLITDENGKDIVTSRGWVTPYSREVVTITSDFSDDNWTTEYMEITANAPGEVTIKGRTEGYIISDQTTIVPKESWPNDIRITIKVTKAASKLTVKQKKCRHSWKTTRKATCQRVGTKTCKKCKLQNTIEKTDHKWITTTRKFYATEDIIFKPELFTAV